MRRLIYLLIVLYAALLPFERILRFVSASIADSIFKPYRVVAMVVVVLWAAWLTVSKRRWRPDLGDKTFFAIFLYGLVMAFFWNALGSADLDYVTGNLPLILFAVSIYVIVKDLHLEEREIERILAAYFVGLAIAMAISISTGDGFSGRLRGFYKNPNQLGVAATTCLLFWIAQFLFVTKARPLAQILRVVCAGVAVAFIGFSGSRGATVGAAAAVLVMLVVSLLRRRARTSQLRLVAFAALLVAFAYPTFDRFDEAIQQTDAPVRFQREQTAESAEERAELWRSGIAVGIDHFGLGAGMMQYLHHHNASIARLRPVNYSERPLGTHSDYVDLFACYGVFGLVAFLRYAFITGKRAFHQARKPRASYLPLLGCALFVQVLVVSISQNSFTGPEYFLVLALVETTLRFEPAAQPAKAAQRPAIAARSPARAVVAAPARS